MYKVIWADKEKHEECLVKGKSSCDVLMSTIKKLSKDGKHATNCRIIVKPVEQVNQGF